MITLFRDGFWISPYVFSCFVALREKGVAFEVREVALQRGEQKDPAYVAASVTGRVPALTHDDFTVAESSAIVEYVDEAFPGVPLLPRDLHARARARQVMAWLRSDATLPIRDARPTHTMFYERAQQPLSQAAATATEKLIGLADRLVAAGGDGGILGAWSMADADLAFALHRLILNDDPVPAPVRAYAEVQWRRPSVVEFLQQSRPPYVPY